MKKKSEQKKAHVYKVESIGITAISSFDDYHSAYSAVIKALRANGWKVRKYKESDIGYIDNDWQIAYNGDLKIRIENDGLKARRFDWNYNFKLSFFEDISPCDNSNGGIYKYNRFDDMPYLLKLLTIKTLNVVKNSLISNGFEFSEDSYIGFKKPLLAIDVIKLRNEAASHHIKPGMDRAKYNGRRTSFDGVELEHKQLAYMRDNGRLIKGVIYYDIGNWIFVYGTHSIKCNVCPGEIIVNPEIKPGRVFSDRVINGNLKRELSSAVSRGDYLRAHQMQQIIFKDVMFRIWSEKHGGGWWRVNGSGYTSDINFAGLFKKDEAERLCKNDNELSMKAVSNES